MFLPLHSFLELLQVLKYLYTMIFTNGLVIVGTTVRCTDHGSHAMAWSEPRVSRLRQLHGVNYKDRPQCKY